MRSMLYGSAAGIAMAVATAMPATAWAQEAAADDTAAVENAGDIIVTAQRVEQRLQDVPISITVFNQEQLTQRNIAVAADLATYTPSLQVNQRYGPEKSAFSIRGFNQDQSTAPTVGVYFAEVVGVRAQGGTTSGNNVGAGAFVDLANVQVLKGPQGTLFGRNTTGGAILLTPQKPTDRLEGFVEGTYGNYDQMKLTAVANIPLADTFKVRLTFERNKRDGYMINRSGVGPHDYNDVDYWYGRLSIVADLTPDLENYTVFHISQSDTRGYASRMIGCANPASPVNPLVTDNILPTGSTPDPVTGLVNPAYSGTRHLQAASCAIQVARQNSRGDSLYDVEVRNPNPSLGIQQWQAINTTTWRASDTITVKNIMSYGEFRERANFDLGASNFVVPNIETSPIFGPGFDLTRISQQLNFAGAVDPVTKLAVGTHLFAVAGTPYSRIVLDTAGPNTANSQQSTFTEELQIQGHTDNLTFVLGGYLEFSRPLGFSSGRTGIFLDCTQPSQLACTNPLRFGSISESSTKLAFDNHGVFAQATYKFGDQFALTGGFRYTFDKIVGYTNGTRAGFSANAGTGPLFADPVSGVMIARACTDSFRHGPAALAIAGLSPPAANRDVCGTTLVNKSSAPTWHVGVDFTPTPDLLFYAKYDRGYRQGGLNFTNPGVESWQPERLDAYEVGAKVTFRGATPGYFNIAGFYNNLSNQQIFAQLIPTPAAAASGVSGGAAIVNAGKSRIYGLEADASVLLFDSLRLTAGYTYLNTQVKEVSPAANQGDGTPLGQVLVGSPFGRIIPNATVGSEFTNAPEHKLAVNGTYTLPLDESVGDVSLGVTWVYQSSYVNDPASPAYVNGIPLGFTPATNLVNLNLDWKRVAGGPIDLAAFVTNVTEETYNVANTQAWNSAGVGEILLNQPRFYGVRVRYNFSRDRDYTPPPPPPPPPPEPVYTPPPPPAPLPPPPPPPPVPGERG